MPVAAQTVSAAHNKKPRTTVAAAPLQDGQAEQRLLQVFTLAQAGRASLALAQAQALVNDYPNFQLAQLVLGDLLLARSPHRAGRDALLAPSQQAQTSLQELYDEFLQRQAAQKNLRADGHIPSQFLQLPKMYRHAIAVDASLSRLYLFENGPQGLRLIADYYASVGKLGIDKVVEGDQRTPLGVYFVTSRLDPKSLRDFYGAGALPLNYPNPLDQQRGKTGHGIWLHGTPPDQFARAPQATDGCIALANPDLERLLRMVEPRTTPVVIAQQLQWQAPQSLEPERQAFEGVLQAWQQAKTSGNLPQLLRFYAPHFEGLKKKKLTQWALELQADVQKIGGRKLQLKDLAYLRWTDSEDTMVVTFGEVMEGQRSGPIKRQYWVREGERWQIFFEGVIG